MRLLAGLLCAMTVVAAAGERESSLLATYGDRAFRPDPGTLCIVTEQGDTLVFADQPEPEYLVDYEVFELTSFLPEQNCWVITKTYCEWAVTLLVNGSNGAIVRAISSPEPSPDGSRLLCAHEDIYGGMLKGRMYQGGIQVWRVDPDSLVLEFQFCDERWAAVEAGWSGDSLIVFDRFTYAILLHEFTPYEGNLRLTAAGIWRLAYESY